MFEQQLPCPVCSTKIPFDAKQLIAGVQFVCPNCQSSIGLAYESKPLVEDALKKLEELKRTPTK
jgi:hypothetical protein